MNKILSVFAQTVSKRFKSVKPLWMVPHKTIYAVANQFDFSNVKIDGRTEAQFDKTWFELFEAGELEDDIIKVTFKDNLGKKQTLKFESNGLKEIHVI